MLKMSHFLNSPYEKMGTESVIASLEEMRTSVLKEPVDCDTMLEQMRTSVLKDPVDCNTISFIVSQELDLLSKHSSRPYFFRCLPPKDRSMGCNGDVKNDHGHSEEGSHSSHGR